MNNSNLLENRILNEESRQSLNSRGKKGANYVPSNQFRGKNRFKRRVHSNVSHRVAQYNKIDMNKLFKDGILTVNIDVNGETDNYVVRISVGGVAEILADEVKKNNGVFDLKVCVKALTTAFNKSDVFIHCTCPDYKYRFEYLVYHRGISSYSKDEEDNIAITEPPKITNPKDDKGSGCKHILLVMSNNSWIIKVASVIKNYVTYVQKHYEQQYADIIYPALYHKPYEDTVQTNMENPNDLSNDKDIIDIANEIGRKSTQFKQGNEYRFKPSNKRVEVNDQTTLFDDEADKI